MYIRLEYRTRRWGEDEFKSVEQKYPIVSTSCNYSGQRYWFICSVYRNGIYCGRRVAKLYKGGGSVYFACRHCYDLTYRSRIDGYAYTDSDLDKLGDSIKKWYYNGRPTRKHLRYLKMEESIERDWNRLFIRLAKKIK